MWLDRIAPSRRVIHVDSVLFSAMAPPYVRKERDRWPCTKCVPCCSICLNFGVGTKMRLSVGRTGGRNEAKMRNDGTGTVAQPNAGDDVENNPRRCSIRRHHHPMCLSAQFPDTASSITRRSFSAPRCHCRRRLSLQGTQITHSPRTNASPCPPVAFEFT